VSILDRLRNTYLRIDARSLGLFRIVMGAALIGDLCLRWSSLRAFYSNDGVLANHVHLFNAFKQEPPLRVWSVFHAFSSPGETAVGFTLTFLVYFFFLIGFKTRLFHVLALALLVSLTGRNLLLEGPANYVAIAVLAATAFLPCGSRFSLDALRDSFKRHHEKDAAALNDRTRPSEQALAAERSPGWSPSSLAALAVLLQLAVIYYAIARQQSGAEWREGTALHYALWVERWVSDLGIHVRSAPAGLLRAWTYLLRYSPFAIPVLLFLPFPRQARPVAFGLMALFGASYGLLFSFGLWGWTFLAAAFLAIPTESWEAWLSRFGKGRALTVIYDTDCGICLWIARLFKRLDVRGQLTFQGNDSLTLPPGQKPPLPGQKPPYRTAEGAAEPVRVLFRREKPALEVTTAALPDQITEELVTGTVAAVDEKGRVFTEGQAVAAMLRSLPFGWLWSLPLRFPGTARLWNALYRLVPPRRYALSELLGMAACGVPIAPDSAAPGAAEPAAAAPSVPPAVRMRRVLSGAVREAGAVVLFLAALAQTAANNPWPTSLTIPQNRVFAAITAWPRMLARYDVLAPEPPTEDGVFVTDAQTRAGRSVDPLTGKDPVFDVPQFRLGLLWSDYTSRMRKKEVAEFEKNFRDYLVKGGPAWPTEVTDNQITGLDAYWLVYKSPPPGGTAVEVVGREKLFTHSRGGRINNASIPILKPGLIR
jgi:predicted DCC family thiol-disulfide oxidoreductase YuxK